MNEVLIECKGVSKTFYSRKSPDSQPSNRFRSCLKLIYRLRVPFLALDNVSFKCRQGEILGLVGPNGAGKTTAIKILCCLLLPDCGTASVYGFDVISERRKVKSAITVLTSSAWSGNLWYLTVRDNLEFYCRLAGLTKAEAQSRASMAMEVLGLKDYANELPWNLSAGGGQKLLLARALMVRTPLVFLDEPTAHLDPIASQYVREFIRKELRDKLGQTILISTNNLREAETLCDRVLLLNNGKIELDSTPTALRRKFADNDTLILQTIGCLERLCELLQDKKFFAGIAVEKTESKKKRVEINLNGSVDIGVLQGIFDLVDCAGVSIESFEVRESNLEEVFQRMIANDTKQLV